MGMSYTPEELGAEVNEEGEVVETPTKQESVETLSTAAPSNEWAEPSDIKTPEVAPDFSHKSVSHAYISERQSKMVYAKMKSLGWENQAILDFLKQWRVSRTDKIAQFQFDEVLKQLDEFQKRVK